MQNMTNLLGAFQKSGNGLFSCESQNFREVWEIKNRLPNKEQVTISQVKGWNKQDLFNLEKNQT